MENFCKIITALFFVGIVCVRASITRAAKPVFDRNNLVLWGHGHVISYKRSIVQLCMDKENGVVLLVGATFCGRIVALDPNFDNNYHVIWGNDHVIPYQKSMVQLYMDQQHGGAGFESKLAYGSGLFEMQIKVPGKESAGVVTAFYLASGTEGDHDELDFEFLGNTAGKPYTLQTNIIIDGTGYREQRFHLWFDPTAQFHTYKILWNKNHVVFFVDNIPIREFKNNERYGVKYLTKPMKVDVSLWDGDNWATNGGRTKTNWSFAPFRAYFEDFDITGCAINGDNMNPCNANSNAYWWNNRTYSELSPTEEKGLRIVKDNYLNYDYCTDKQKHPVTPPECSHQ